MIFLQYDKLINCTDEQYFKVFWADEVRRAAQTSYYFLETEETNPGMPDILFAHGKRALKDLNEVFFYEIKVSDKHGYIQFTKAQPLFYKNNPNLAINIAALDTRGKGIVVVFKPEEMPRISISRRIKLPENTECLQSLF